MKKLQCSEKSLGIGQFSLFNRTRSQKGRFLIPVDFLRCSAVITTVTQVDLITDLQIFTCDNINYSLIRWYLDLLESNILYHLKQ
jgi:hypothetical protein